MIRNFLFPSKPDDTKISALLLIARLVFGILLFTHGFQKFSNFDQLSGVFPDPLGVGSKVSLSLAIFGEGLCSLAFILGFLYRLAVIPMIFTMCMAFFVFHSKDPFSVKELAFVYFVIFVLMYIAGPGKYAIDRMFTKK